jgi:hypothetical protein
VGLGEGGVTKLYSHLAKRCCPTGVGDLVGFVGDYKNFVGYGVVVKAYSHNSVVRWVNSGEYCSEKNINLYVIAEGTPNARRST